jgi:hypothetical protein
MNDIVHAEVSWLMAQGLASRRDRRLIVLAGIAPDLDGLPVFVSHAAYEACHHVLFHGILGALLTTAICTALARSRMAVLFLSLAAFHLHLLCDIAGSGIYWPIAYFWPWSSKFYGWSHGWELVSWQNELIGFVATVACLLAAIPWGRTPVEVFSPKADRPVVDAIRARARHLRKDAPAHPDAGG